MSFHNVIAINEFELNYIDMYILQAVYVPMPRHMYGELARSQIGCSVLEQHKIIHNLLLAAKNDRTPSDLKRAALWGLGHIWYHTIQYNTTNPSSPLCFPCSASYIHTFFFCTFSWLCSYISSFYACLLLSSAFYTFYYPTQCTVHNI